MYCVDKLNVAIKNRSNPFTWRGQFTPELIEYFLDTYASPGMLIADPFSGSGTVLLTSLERRLDVIGCEINPAAYAMSKFFEIGAMPIDKKRDLCEAVWQLLSKSTSDIDKPIHQESKTHNYREHYENLIAFARQLLKLSVGKYQLVLTLNILFKMEKYKKLSLLHGWQKAYGEVSSFLTSLPESVSLVSALLSDARNLHSSIDRKVDLIITSPPYINVFNYHQNHRIIMDMLGFDAISVADSEFGANRKNRGNRFLTVIQYCIDMGQALCSMRQAISESGKAILIVGRESNVKKTPFYNGMIIKDLCQRTNLFSIADASERCFRNKFGTIIYEDILTLRPDQPLNEDIDQNARTIANSHLLDAISRAHPESRIDLGKAINMVDTVLPSPKYTYKKRR